MPQTYHANATTNIHIRREINKSNLPNTVLAEQHKVSLNTVSKWKNRDSFEDASSRPHNIEYALTPVQETLVVSIRNTTWASREEIAEMLSNSGISVSISSVYRCLVNNGINRKPKEARQAYAKFKEYTPGYIHMDVTYMPRINGIRYYLFVAIDRTTRLMFYRLYDEKSAENAADFMNRARKFFPFIIDIVLTDNGKEFSNKLYKGRSGASTEKEGKFDIACGESTEHRLTKPGTPKTNGMVERANLTIKVSTIHRVKYQSLQELSDDLEQFLVFYNLYRRHGGLVKELKVRTPIEACIRWLELQPELFYRKTLIIGKNVIPLQCENSHFQQ